MEDSNQLKFSISSEGKMTLFDSLNNSKLINKEILLPYLNNLYKDLASRASKFEKTGISKYEFLKYCNLPGIIGEKFFAIFDEKNENAIQKDNFVKYFIIFYCGEFKEKINLIFQIYDFKHKGTILAEDVRLILSHIPLRNIQKQMEEKKKLEKTSDSNGLSNQTLNNKDIKERMETQDDINELIEECFEAKAELNYKEFENIILQKSSDMFLEVYILLRNSLPINDQLPFILKLNSKKDNLSSGPNTPILSTPKFLKRNLPVKEISKITGSNTPKLEGSRKQSTFSSILSKFSLPSNAKEDELTKTVRKRSQILNLLNQDKQDKSEIIIKTSNSFNINKSKTENLEDSKGQIITKVNPANNKEEYFCGSCNSVLSNIDSSCLNCIKSNSQSAYSGILYMLISNNNYSKKWVILRQSELFIFENQAMNNFPVIISLKGINIKDKCEHSTIGNNITLCLFELDFTLNSKVFGAERENDKADWIKAIEKAKGQIKITDNYTLQEIIENTRFGFVQKATNKSTKVQFSVENVKKSKMRKEEFESMRNQCEILKLCQHPNIIRFYEFYEDQDSYYLVKEYTQGGNLSTYLESVKFAPSDEEALKLIKCLCSGIFYLHNMGIVHRDLNTNNIILGNKNDITSLKIGHFSCSKILGSGEKCNDLIGQLDYVAPEMLLNQPYDKACDIWSLGVISYLILTGSLPFQDKNEEELALKIVKSEPSFNNDRWKKVCLAAKDFVIALLEKDSSKRMNINDAMNLEYLMKS